MKSNVLLALLFLVCATGSVMSMEHNKARLNFLTSHTGLIKGYSAQDMKFDKQPSEFVGKNILEVVPLNKRDKQAVNQGFNDALLENKTVKIPYDLEGAAFLATITPMVKANKKNNFFVKVTPFDDSVKIDD